jgi:hypothetical protein
MHQGAGNRPQHRTGNGVMPSASDNDRSRIVLARRGDELVRRRAFTNLKAPTHLRASQHLLGLLASIAFKLIQHPRRLSHARAAHLHQRRGMTNMHDDQRDLHRLRQRRAPLQTSDRITRPIHPNDDRAIAELRRVRQLPESIRAVRSARLNDSGPAGKGKAARTRRRIDPANVLRERTVIHLALVRAARERTMWPWENRRLLAQMSVTVLRRLALPL